ncbi:MAG TPA: hypothetical protein VFP34_08845 [Microlunatus sp.]|nr:hypothetical protein [Microlunatus sp.]
MRQFAGRLNRVWLTVIGIVLTLTGVLTASIGLGLLGRVVSPSAGITVPETSDRIFGPGTAGLFEQPGAIAAVAVVGLVLGLLGLAWLLSQLPRSNAAKAFRLQDDAVRGLTVCHPDVLTAAVEDDAETLPGVTKAQAVIRGTAGAPELTLKITANDRSDIAQLLLALQSETAGHLAIALETPLRHLAAQIDITTTRRTADHITL